MDFGKLADDWWDPNGPMRPLHRLNPTRIGYIREVLGGVEGKTILDIGCGAGLVCEPLSRLGASMTGIDRAPELIQTAQNHAQEQGLTIDYRAMDLTDITEAFDAVLLLEVVEHVDDPAALIKQATERLKPGGKIVLSTLNRTAKSFALGKIAAEYLLRWVPVGTHDWDMFIKPHELVAHAEAAGLRAADLCGLVYRPFDQSFALDKSNLSINYFLTCQKG